MCSFSNQIHQIIVFKLQTNKRMKKIYLTCLLLCFAAMAFKGTAQTYPSGFSQVLVANGISSPTIMQFAPDGRLFIAQQAGALRVVKNGALLTKPFITLTVSSSGERGLLGIAFDPSFSTNNFIQQQIIPIGH